MPFWGGEVPAHFLLVHQQKLGAAPAPGRWFGGGRCDVPAQRPWDEWHLDTRGAFPGDSRGNFQPQHPWEEQQPCLCSPSLPAPRGVTSHLPVTAPSCTHPVTYGQGNQCQQPQYILEMSKQSQQDLKKPGGDMPGGITADGEGEGILQVPGLSGRIAPAFIPKGKII